MLGTGGKSAVKRTVRVHGNFAEHAPFALLLISMTKMRAAASWVVHTLCRVLAIGCVSQASGVSQADEVLEFRVTGMMLTVGVFITSVVAIALT